ncbi:hypothetical protein [Pedobacter gandavensis]|uniref:hypothetical protein n=1 Tax=Pedobacter gandavensis TaxID=2679963 RepID=UPI00292EF38A|nr:hypothetical protein [Pedobacter gandavensis]
MEPNTNAGWILGLKHWQFFALLVAPRALEYFFFSFGNPNGDYYWVELCYWIYTLSLICGWLYFTTINLQPLLPSAITMNIKKFKWEMGFTFFPPFFLLTITLLREINGNGGSGFFELLAFIGLILLYPIICLFKSMYRMIRTLKEVELQRPVSKSDFDLSDLSILYPLIGAWVFQPRINQVYEYASRQKLNVEE